MSEIVFTDTTERRGHIKHMTQGRTPSDEKVTIFQSPNKVAFVTSTLVVGVPRGHSDKRYYHWRSTESFGFRRNRAGNIMSWQCTRPFDAKTGVEWGHRQPRQAFQMLDESDDWEAAAAFKRAVWYTFGIRKAEDIFPMMPEYGLRTYWSVPSSLRSAFRVNDWSEYAARGFGKTRATPRLVAAVKQTDPYIIAYAQQFRGLVDDEKMVKFMEDNHFDDEMEESFVPHSPNIRPGLLVATQELRDGLITSGMDFNDMRRIQNMVTFNNPKMMKELFANRKVTRLAHVWRSW